MKRIFVLTLTVCFLTPARAGMFYEHKYIGDIAFKNFIELNHLQRFFTDTLHFPIFGTNDSIPFYKNKAVINYYQGMFAIQGRDSVYSYGDFSGLAGDHTVDFSQLYEALIQDTDALAGIPVHPLFPALLKQANAALKSHRETIEKGGREGGFFSLSYAIIADEDKSHFQRPPLSFEEMLQLLNADKITYFDNFASTKATGRNDKKLRKKFDTYLLNLNNASKYAIMHMFAETEMRAAADFYRLKNIKRFIASFKAALLINAFADHFLQDAFAGGHIPVQRNMQGLDNKGVHDFYCRTGIVVHNSRKAADGYETWRTFGDNYYDDATFNHAIDANMQSLQELWGWFTTYVNAFNNHKPIDPLITRLRDSTATEKEWPARLRNSFHAYDYMPVPLTPQFYHDSIKLKHGSRSGFYYEVAYASAFWPYKFITTNVVGSATFGFIGLNAIVPGTCMSKSYRVKAESVFWFGFSVNYNYAYYNKTADNRIYLGFNTISLENVAFDLGLGPAISDGRAQGYGYGALGGEYKSPRCRVAPSLKIFAEVETGHKPATGIKIALRIY